MSKSAKAAVLIGLIGAASPVFAESHQGADASADTQISLPAGYQGESGFSLGREATPDEIAVWDIDVRPDGMGLPKGKGDVATGEEIFTESCAVCHGDFGEGRGRWPVLAGGKSTLTDARPVKTVGSYWPYLSTVFDYVHRAMPFGNAQSLSADDTYAITAYLLYLNDLVPDDFELSDANFTSVKLPNEDGFKPDDRPETELGLFSEEACMTDCKPEVKITARAAVVDVTPDDTAAREARAAKAKDADSGVTETDAAVPPASQGEGVDVPAAGSDAAAPASEAPAPEPEKKAEAAPAAPDPELVADGKKVFRTCKACHQVGENAKNRTGPVLNGVVGAPAGHIEDFRYSSALKDAAAGGLVWTPEELSAFLEKPRKHLKGTKMSFTGLRKEKDRDAIIAYLSTFPK
ncbi:c-type cytochrome [Brevirhabdus sp.]|uniref:c-type cytochrome n=1 Tax=Brevirhabdus sp. TaxID=2004514 RepID=UPI00405824C3